MNSALYKENNFKNHILKLIQPVLDSVSEMQGIWLKFVDTTGKYILTSKTTKPCGFCQLIRSVPVGLRRCHNTARLAVSKSMENRGPIKTKCHAGLAIVTVPVMIEDECLGAIMVGEIIEEQCYEQVKLKVLQNTNDLPIDKGKLHDSFDTIPLRVPEKVDVVVRSLDALSKCFIEMGVAHTKKEKTEMEKYLKEMELKALQNQINPHFLFNSLNTIEMLAIMEGANQTSQIVHALGELFRHNLYSNTYLVSIKREMESVNNYLTIQQYRFGDRLRVINTIPNELMSMEIPILTLQPLVENAVVHGLEPKEGPGYLKLEGCLESGDIILKCQWPFRNLHFWPLESRHFWSPKIVNQIIPIVYITPLPQ